MMIFRLSLSVGFPLISRGGEVAIRCMSTKKMTPLKTSSCASEKKTWFEGSLLIFLGGEYSQVINSLNIYESTRRCGGIIIVYNLQMSVSLAPFGDTTDHQFLCLVKGCSPVQTMLPREQHPSKQSRAWRNLPQQSSSVTKFDDGNNFFTKKKRSKVLWSFVTRTKRCKKYFTKMWRCAKILSMDSRQVHVNIVYRIAQVHLVYIIYRATVTVTGFHKSTVPSLINSFGWWFPIFLPTTNRFGGFGHTSTVFGTTRNRSTEIRTFQINQIQTSIDWVSWKSANWKPDWLIDDTNCNSHFFSWRFPSHDPGENNRRITLNV